MNAQGEAGAGGLLAPSPQSEAVTHEMEELSLQPSQNLPPLNERKNGESPEHTCSPGAGQSIHMHFNYTATNIDTFRDIHNLDIITFGMSVTVMRRLPSYVIRLVLAVEPRYKNVRSFNSLVLFVMWLNCDTLQNAY